MKNSAITLDRLFMVHARICKRIDTYQGEKFYEEYLPMIKLKKYIEMHIICLRKEWQPIPFNEFNIFKPIRLM